MKTSVIGYPRIGALRELKFASEKYFKNEITLEELKETAARLRKAHWEIQKQYGVDFIPSNDFSFYDNLLDTAALLNIIPERYRSLGLNEMDTYFAMARGYQGARGDVKALAMKKWFNTNYHYIVPEVEDETRIELKGTKPFAEYLEAKSCGVETKPVVTGAYTLLKSVRFTGTKNIAAVKADVIRAYQELLKKFGELGTEWVQFDEPALVLDLTQEDLSLLTELYGAILEGKGGVKVLAQTYFGDVRDCWSALLSLPFDGLGLDFVEGTRSLELLRGGFPEEKTLFAGVVNGKNIWKNNYEKTLDILSKLSAAAKNVVIGTSCSLLHVPYTIHAETKLSDAYTQYFAFAEEKLGELSELKEIASAQAPKNVPAYAKNRDLFARPRDCVNEAVQKKAAAVTEQDFTRLPAFEKRAEIQKSVLKLPLLPTTTIGSFPQTADVRANRTAFKKGTITEDQYKAFNRQKIAECVALQEKIGLDVLVHGEFERNDMVEYFGECLDGFLFTEKAWVQSYGTRCVKPPIIWGDISRSKPMTVEYSVYAQSLTERPVKGMLTGPVTILNWSFPREDVSFRESAMQIALAIREEVLDLEASGIRIIQIDEAALREKLPLRHSDRHSQYLDWAIPAFRLVHSGVKPETQIHTHMCYSEFEDIIKEIDDMDADVITFEASRSDLRIIEVLQENHFRTAVGPGVYDIHSPRVPSVEEIETALRKMLERIPAEKLWVNPDCGLKTRGNEETVPSLEHLVAAAHSVRESL
ncbi:MAG TPA: 5-methyltetrahydropteroyltriglutamate--homocysteine S-methyltransferase [Clostridiales bacterium]|nr:5-methyltetrahydropteroyltriglutamate--homocysteine S-methyltransferase [Clostridiales bacterium]